VVDVQNGQPDPESAGEQALDMEVVMARLFRGGAVPPVLGSAMTLEGRNDVT
jgi:hypothetical protein